MEGKLLELTEKLDAATRAIPKLFGLVKWLIIGAFAIGGYAATIDFRQSQLEEDVVENKEGRAANELRIRSIETRAATVDAKLEAIKETVIRIDRKMP